MALYSRPRHTRLLVATLVVASLLTISIDFREGQRGPLEVAGKATLQVVALLQGAVSRVTRPVTDFFTGLAHVGSLRAENQRLRDRVRELESRNAQIISLQRENEELTRLLRIREQLQLRRTVAARVIGQSVGNFDWSVVIDAGSAEGVRPDMAVISGDGLVGHVVEVAPHASKVELIIDPDSAVAARLASSGETGLVVGERDQPLKMDLVDPNARVSPNEEVTTAGYRGGIYPPGIPIGVVSHVVHPPGSLTTTIEIAPAVDFSALDRVLVVVR